MTNLVAQAEREKEARDLCEVLGIPFDDAGVATEKWLRQFAAKVIRDTSSHYCSLIDHSRPPEDVALILERRAKEIEGGE
jgi:hypothetical protein